MLIQYRRMCFGAIYRLKKNNQGRKYRSSKTELVVSRRRTQKIKFLKIDSCDNNKQGGVNLVDYCANEEQGSITCKNDHDTYGPGLFCTLCKSDKVEFDHPLNKVEKEERKISQSLYSHSFLNNYISESEGNMKEELVQSFDYQLFQKQANIHADRLEPHVYLTK